MANFDYKIEKPTTGGPYAYALFRNGTALKVATGLTTPNGALNAVRDDIAAAIIAGESIIRMGGTVQTVEP